jgi:hypothetical protein
MTVTHPPKQVLPLRQSDYMLQVAKIGDFGLSKAFDQAGLSGHTMSGDGFRGTAHFMCQRVADFKADLLKAFEEVSV